MYLILQLRLIILYQFSAKFQRCLIVLPLRLKQFGDVVFDMSLNLVHCVNKDSLVPHSFNLSKELKFELEKLLSLVNDVCLLTELERHWYFVIFLLNVLLVLMYFKNIDLLIMLFYHFQFLFPLNSIDVNGVDLLIDLEISRFLNCKSMNGALMIKEIYLLVIQLLELVMSLLILVQYVPQYHLSDVLLSEFVYFVLSLFGIELLLFKRERAFEFKNYAVIIMEANRQFVDTQILRNVNLVAQFNVQSQDFLTELNFSFDSFQVVETFQCSQT